MMNSETACEYLSRVFKPNLATLLMEPGMGYHLRQKIANRSKDPALLDAIVQFSQSNKSEGTLHAIACNKYTSPETLDRLAVLGAHGAFGLEYWNRASLTLNVIRNKNTSLDTIAWIQLYANANPSEDMDQIYEAAHSALLRNFQKLL